MSRGGSWKADCMGAVPLRIHATASKVACKRAWARLLTNFTMSFSCVSSSNCCECSKVRKESASDIHFMMCWTINSSPPEPMRASPMAKSTFAPGSHCTTMSPLRAQTSEKELWGCSVNN